MIKHDIEYAMLSCYVWSIYFIRPAKTPHTVYMTRAYDYKEGPNFWTFSVLSASSGNIEGPHIPLPNLEDEWLRKDYSDSVGIIAQ